MPIINCPVVTKELVYEYRSGNLVKGVLADDGGFAPDMGGKILPLKEYLQAYDPKKALRVYNLPGTVVESPRPSGTGKPQYEYKEALSRWVAQVWWSEQRRQVKIGHLDRTGKFIEDNKLKLVLINKPLRPKEPVYEFRSGNLIKGILEDDGSFVPDVGSKVIPLKDYLKFKDDPSKGLRIYNLPGRIIKKEKKNGGKGGP